MSARELFIILSLLTLCVALQCLRHKRDRGQGGAHCPQCGYGLVPSHPCCTECGWVPGEKPSGVLNGSLGRRWLPLVICSASLAGMAWLLTATCWPPTFAVLTHRAVLLDSPGQIAEAAVGAFSESHQDTFPITDPAHRRHRVALRLSDGKVRTYEQTAAQTWRTTQTNENGSLLELLMREDLTKDHAIALVDASVASRRMTPPEPRGQGWRLAVEDADGWTHRPMLPPLLGAAVVFVVSLLVGRRIETGLALRSTQTDRTQIGAPGAVRACGLGPSRTRRSRSATRLARTTS